MAKPTAIVDRAAIHTAMLASVGSAPPACSHCRRGVDVGAPPEGSQEPAGDHPGGEDERPAQVDEIAGDPLERQDRRTRDGDRGEGECDSRLEDEIAEGGAQRLIDPRPGIRCRGRQWTDRSRPSPAPFEARPPGIECRVTGTAMPQRLTPRQWSKPGLSDRACSGGDGGPRCTRGPPSHARG